MSLLLEQAPASIISCSTRWDDFIRGHVFEGKLYFTKHILDRSFVSRNRKPKPILKLEDCSKACPKGQACVIV